jgi:hypothetical protein
MPLKTADLWQSRHVSVVYHGGTAASKLNMFHAALEHCIFGGHHRYADAPIRLDKPRQKADTRVCALSKWKSEARGRDRIKRTLPLQG